MKYFAIYDPKLLWNVFPETDFDEKGMLFDEFNGTILNINFIQKENIVEFDKLEDAIQFCEFENYAYFCS